VGLITPRSVVQIYPPLLSNYPPINERIVKALLTIRNLSDCSQKTYSKCLKRLSRETDLDDPLKVEDYVYSKEWSNKTKKVYFDAYSHYCKANEIEWIRPRLNSEAYPVKIPTEQRIDMIISSCTKKYATVFHISKHGLRPDEISKITLRDIDLDRGILTVRTSKLGIERTIKLNKITHDLLKEYAYSKEATLNNKLFAKTKTLREKWVFYRNKAFDKFKDHELLKIRLYDLRHWFGTTQYIKTRDIFHVKYLMGHRNIESTLHYMHIAKGLVNYSDEYTVKVASTIEEFTTLLETGFEYISDYGDKKILRKRK
jgi:integrase